MKVLIDSEDTDLPIFTDIINSSIRNGTFPEELELAKVTLLFEKVHIFDKVNHGPVSLMSHVSKVCERIIFNQISTYFEAHFSSFVTGFCKNHNTQHPLPNTIELCKEALDKGNSVGAILMDLSKAFDTVIHVLSKAKLEAYIFSKNSLNYIQSYLRNCLQRTNVNNNFSLWEDIFTDVRQRCILGSLMFNIYINVIFLFTDNVCLSNYADDTTLYSTGENHNKNRNISNNNRFSLQKWFYDNYMVLKSGKCCYMCFGSNPDKSDLILEGSTKTPSAEEYIILGVTISNRLTFYYRLKNLCKKLQTN